MNEESSELKLHALDYWQVIRNRYGIILLTFLLIFLSAGVITYILPKQFDSTVVLEVEAVGTDVEVFERNSGAANPFYNHRFLDTQFEIITSQINLYEVIDSLGLVDRWGLTSKDQAFRTLRGRIETSAHRGTDLIEITVFSTDPKEAAELANAVADNYRSRRMDTELGRDERALDALEVEFDKAKDSMEQARTRMLDIMEATRFIDLAQQGRGLYSTPETGSTQNYALSRNAVYELKSQISALESNINTLKDLEGEELIKSAASLNLQDNTITERYRSYNDLILAEQEMYDSGLGRRHPRVIAVQNQLAGVHQMCLEAAENVKRSFDTQLDIARSQLAGAEGIEEDTANETMEDRRLGVEYQEAQSDYQLSSEIVASIETKLATKRVEMALPRTPIILHERAEPAEHPSKPNVNLNLLLGAVVGLIFGLALAFFLEYLDTSVKTIEEVEKYLGVPVLAVIPKDVGVLHKQSGASPDAEAYRILRTNIEFNRKNADANAMTVVSGGAGEGKSTTLVNLAYICAQGGYTTLLIDGDLRRPSLHTFFDISNSVGLTNYLTTDVALENVVLQTPVDNLFFMPSGILPADAAGILNSRRMSELIADVKSRFDLVLVDSPPILGVSDASVLASEVDQTLIVIQHRKLPRNMLVRVKQAIESVGGSVIGAVLNNVDVRSDNQYQYYTSYYTYYSPSNTGEQYAEPAEVQGYQPAAPAAPAAPPQAFDPNSDPFGGGAGHVTQPPPSAPPAPVADPYAQAGHVPQQQPMAVAPPSFVDPSVAAGAPPAPAPAHAQAPAQAPAQAFAPAPAPAQAQAPGMIAPNPQHPGDQF